MGDSTSLFLLTKDIVCSFYEYLLKVWIQGNKTPAVKRYRIELLFALIVLLQREPLAADAKLSLIYAGDAGNMYCYSGSLIASKVAGKIVVCDRGSNARVEKGSAVKLACGLALVLANTEDSGEELIADSHLIPATMVGQINGEKSRLLMILAADAKLSLIYAGDAGNMYCYSGSLIASKVAGKIVVCDRGGNARVEKGSAVKLACGLALVLANTEDSGEELIADSHLIPATMVGQINGDKIKQYIKSSDDPAATILFRGTVIGSSPAAPKGKNQDF
ncbi:hypothetical protein F8388_016495 [Cannabis sativa]|uniref:PA domain-containing protein n=1 Tax=Cannabis sativa TaxID=3483 RepID=A0A7J6EQN3_CANSA|nr:hypothetical protein F8388_016495 [Cannabis sativa]